jgi:hypothetical protein
MKQSAAAVLLGNAYLKNKLIILDPEYIPAAEITLRDMIEEPDMGHAVGRKQGLSGYVKQI